MSLHLYLDELFNSGGEVDQVDTYSGNGSQVTFTLVNKSASRLSSTIQFASTQYLQYNGGFTKNTGAGTFTLTTAPLNGTQGVAPGTNQITAVVFDQEVVPGVTNPRVDEVPFVIGDGSEIHLFTWGAAPGNTGIELTVVDLISSVGASPTWCQLATASVAGTYTYLATGVTLSLPAITAGGSIASSMFAGSTSVVVDTGSSFSYAIGGYVKIAPGRPNEEIRRITGVTGSTLLLNAPTDFAHNAIGLDPTQFVFHLGWPCSLKVTVPVDVTDNTAVNFYDVGVQVEGRGAAR